jgi:hypothetical protein
MRFDKAAIILGLMGLAFVSAKDLNMEERPTAAVCRDGWKEFGGHCYKLFSDRLWWEAAENYCQDLGGHLTSVHSQAENDFLQDLKASGIIYLGATLSADQVFPPRDENPYTLGNQIIQ